MTESPLFPEGAGEILRSILNPEPVTGGPPYTHVFRDPPDEYDDEGNLLFKPIGPSMTVLPPLRPEAADVWRIALRQQIAATHPKPIIAGPGYLALTSLWPEYALLFGCATYVICDFCDQWRPRRCNSPDMPAPHACPGLAPFLDEAKAYDRRPASVAPE